ncbi:MAG: 23S rRNA (adenine(2030)-N(6))-methyltransferase RlmJ [Treponema sp.]|nr:23S rRNA (adenine(2030)-N(6))-methyltransferase RlmJ [Treponema sp.]
MLSYLHAFHAGNHADILKHAALVQLLKKLNQKSAPYSFFDTHAGSGLYSTSGEKARKTGEAQKGVLALAACLGKNQEASQAQDAGAALSDYLDFVRPYLSLDLYPGSPLIERAFLRPDDAHTICELHPAEYESLK